LIFEQGVYSFAVDYIQRLFKDINTHLLRKFILLFKKNDLGHNRDWTQLDENLIRDLWHKCRQQMDPMIKSEFKYVKLPKAPLTQNF